MVDSYSIVSFLGAAYHLYARHVEKKAEAPKLICLMWDHPGDMCTTWVWYNSLRLGDGNDDKKMDAIMNNEYALACRQAGEEMTAEVIPDDAVAYRCHRSRSDFSGPSEL